MGGNPVLPGWDMFVLAVPILGFLAMMMFRLDELYASASKRPGRSRSFCGVDGRGSAVLSDPDGRPWQRTRSLRVEATLLPLDGPEWNKTRAGNQSRSSGRSVIHGYVMETNRVID